MFLVHCSSELYGDMDEGSSGIDGPLNYLSVPRNLRQHSGALGELPLVDSF